MSTPPATAPAPAPAPGPSAAGPAAGQPGPAAAPPATGGKSSAGPATGNPAGAPPADPGGSPATPDTSLGSKDRRATGVDLLSAGQRRVNLRQAESMLFGGDLVGGNKYVMLQGGGEPAPLQRLAAWLSDPVRHAFVPPQRWDDIHAEAAGKRIVVLRAAPGYGKVAAAIRLLQGRPDSRIYNLDRTVDLAGLGHWLDTDARGDDPLPRGSGFLLCEPEGWHRVPGWVLQQLEVALDRIDARLVLTLPAGTALLDKDIVPYVVPLHAPPDQSAVLAGHLTWRLGGSEDTVARILRDKALAELVEEAFTGDPSMKVAADLAVMISQVLDGATVNLDKLRKRWAERTTEDFDIWFGGLPDVRTRSLAISLAVLNGLPYESVVRAAQRLSDRLDGPPAIVADARALPPWRDPFAGTRRELLRLLRAQVRPAVVQGAWGAAPAEVIEYADAGYAEAVLERVWREYQVQMDLLGWLRELADDRTEEVRVWAATALGLLSTYAFDFVYSVALRPMTLDEEKFWLRDVVAYALRVPAADSRLRALVESVIGQLYANEDLPIGQATAARSYGVALGPLDPESALAALERLAIFDDWRIARAIGDSLADLLLADEDRNAARVLSRLSTWLSDKKRTLTAQYVFLLLAEVLTVEPGTGTTGGRTGASGAARGAWPMLLLLADQRPQLRQGLLGMWGTVLRAGSLEQRTEGVLAQWADMAEADPGVLTAFARMLAAIPHGAGQYDRAETQIRRQIKLWRAADVLRPKPRTARAVEAALTMRNGA
ncbi:hypothetical protein [Actinoplanes sp. N902-109]|uniref:hypothetical protein n=1 Tax=Actinoplanes sp. (strain N902-109) TaxID=649831 RepID=UPI00032941D9|nr:hypothetical protein [Actinoplanes sp. N902-109]AGL18925.1 hypothetical protein L083_5415 [Actinoplanes sp. N902-109]